MNIKSRKIENAPEQGRVERYNGSYHRLHKRKIWFNSSYDRKTYSISCNKELKNRRMGTLPTLPEEKNYKSKDMKSTIKDIAVELLAAAVLASTRETADIVQATRTP